jgi:hypothetical protein
MSQKLITIAQFNYFQDLIVIKSLLQEADIIFFTKDEETVTVDPLLSNAVGGIRLQVGEDDVIRAKRIVDEYFETNKNTKVVWEDPEDEEYFKEANINQKRNRGFTRLILLFVLLIMAFSIILGYHYGWF